MAIMRGVQGTRRAQVSLQRWLMRLIMFSSLLYGSVIVMFWAKQHKYVSISQPVVRQRALKGIQDQKTTPEAIQLLRIDTHNDQNLSHDMNKLETASKHRAVETLPEIGEESMDKQVGSSMLLDNQITDKPLTSMTIRTETSSETESSADITVEINTSSHSSALEATPNGATVPLRDDYLQLQAEEHARLVKFLHSGETKKRVLKCVGWRNTGDCSPDGPRQPHKDLTCSEFVPNNASGYCEVEDTHSGERFRVMRRACNILRNRVPFRCINAPAFARFRVQAHTAMKSASATLPNIVDPTITPRDGIVMVVYPKLVPSAYATICALRELLGCSLPIEIWYRPDELENAPRALVPLQNLAKNTLVGQISFHEILDHVAKRFVAKIYAINHSFFDRVLFLDADNVPVRDPSFLFDTFVFKQTGAIFWPDFWHPTSTMFGLHNRSLLWELLDTPFVDMFEQESGQLVVDRRRHSAPLKLVLFYATHDPNFLVHYKLAWGDKDLFRLAWLKLNSSFHMIETPPAMAGMVTNLSAFCGMTMVQHDLEGNVLFLHRNKHKLTGTAHSDTKSTDDEAEMEGSFEEPTENSSSGNFDAHSHSLKAEIYPDPAIWTHLMSFDGNWTRDHYVIQAFTTSLDFTSKQKCFGRRSVHFSPQFQIHTIANQKFAGLETELRHFVMQAAEDLQYSDP